MRYHPFRNLGLKALSVAIALLLWLSVSGEQIVERSLRVPLELQNIPDKLRSRLRGLLATPRSAAKRREARTSL